MGLFFNFYSLILITGFKLGVIGNPNCADGVSDTITYSIDLKACETLRGGIAVRVVTSVETSPPVDVTTFGPATYVVVPFEWFLRVILF